ncbi:MAG: ribonuclease III [Clostridiales bacterium]|nr:ribonuclease III [Clostridiales bacterium]
MNDLEKTIKYTFDNHELLKTALTHSSFANENRSKKLKSNERLEFLGDSVLGFLCAEYLLNTHPDYPEGELTKIRAAIVCEQALFEVSDRIGLREHLCLGCGEEASGGRSRPSILADAVESLLAAIYLDGGIDAAHQFAMEFIIIPQEKLAIKGKAFKDYKTALQEIVQKNHEEVLSYRVKSEEGPDHDKTFTVELMLNSNVFSEGTGRSKKEAEQMAAKAALALMGQE